MRTRQRQCVANYCTSRNFSDYLFYNFKNAVFHANMKNFSIEKNLLIYSLDNNNKFTKKHVSYFILLRELIVSR